MKPLTANKLDEATFDLLLANAVDITGAANVQVMFNECTRTVHVNINGLCVLRVCRAETMDLEETKFRSAERKQWLFEHMTLPKK